MRGHRIVVEDGSFLQVLVGSQQEQISPHEEVVEDMITPDAIMDEVYENPIGRRSMPSSSTLEVHSPSSLGGQSALQMLTLITRSRSGVTGWGLFLIGLVAEAFQLQV